MESLDDKTHLTQGVSLHHYTLPTKDWDSKGSSTDFGEEMWFKTIKNTMVIEDYIQQHLAIMDKYDPEKKIKLIVDEWGTWYDKLPGTKEGFLQQQNTLRDALVAGINLNIFNNHADRISMANVAQIVNVLQSVIRTNGAQMVKTPTYYTFQMYNVHQDAQLIPTTLDTENYEFNGESIPGLTASASEKDGVVNITITNANPEKAMPLNLDLGKSFKNISGKIVNAKNITDYNDFGKKEKVMIQDFNVPKAKGNAMSVEIPAHSIVLMQLQ